MEVVILYLLHRAVGKIKFKNGCKTIEPVPGHIKSKAAAIIITQIFFFILTPKKAAACTSNSLFFPTEKCCIFFHYEILSVLINISLKMNKQTFRCALYRRKDAHRYLRLLLYSNKTMLWIGRSVTFKKISNLL